MKKKINYLMTGALLISTFSMVACDKSSNSTSILGEVKNYSINFSAISGKKLNDIPIEIYNGTKLVQSLYTDENGNVNFSIPEGNYDVKLMEIPAGHYIDKELKLTKGVYDYDFVLPSKVITDGEPSGTYKLQDIMYDFTLTTSDGSNFTLSEALEDRSAVMINFWYTTCSWCLEEFPYMEEAYKEYQDEIEIIAITNRDVNPVIEAFKYEYELTFPMAYDNIGITSLFGIVNYPTTIFIDRYGIISYAYEGSVESKEEMCEIFDKFIGDDYIPLTSIVEEEIDNTIPNVTMPASEDIEKAINAEGFSATYTVNEDEETIAYTWPWLISEDGKSIYNSNQGIDSTAATIVTNIVIPEGKVLAFDYLASTEKDYDILYVIVDGTVIHQISGVETNWKTCFAYVSEETKSYEISLCYLKDYEGSGGEDLISITNMRFVEIEDIDTPTYIYRYCSKNEIESNKNYSNYNYEIYSSVYYNEEDGYYHVNSITGPLVLADLLYATHWSKELTPYLMATYDQAIVNGEDYDDIITEYASYSSNGTDRYTPVTEELYQALKALTNYYGDSDNENEWLELCGFYSAYYTDGVEYQDPTKGLATHNAYDAQLGDENYAVFTKPILPRGLKFKFIPETSGVYKINSIGTEETLCWILDKNGDIIAEADFYARDFCYEENNRLNFVMYYYFEAGQTYFINPAFYDYLYAGSLQFNIEYIGDTFELFTLCSPGYYTTSLDEEGNMTNEIISTGINVTLESDGYYHELREDGTVGSIIYADFIYTNVFNYTLTQLAQLGAFDFTLDENNETIEGGVDMTDTALKYAMSTIKDEGDLYGCVPVDEELKELLVLLMDKYGYNSKEYPGCKDQWLKLCYYHQYIGPIEA